MTLAIPARSTRRRLSDSDYKYQHMAFASAWSTFQLEFQIKEARALLASKELCEKTSHRTRLALEVFETVLTSRSNTRR